MVDPAKQAAADIILPSAERSEQVKEKYLVAHSLNEDVKKGAGRASGGQISRGAVWAAAAGRAGVGGGHSRRECRGGARRCRGRGHKGHLPRHAGDHAAHCADDAGQVHRRRAPAAPAVTVAPAAAVDEAGVTYIKSPMVGTFYSSPSPESKAFAEVGTAVTETSVVCIIEAMKIMNEIQSEVKGTVVEVLVENGEPVEYGQRLFKLKSS